VDQVEHQALPAPAVLLETQTEAQEEAALVVLLALQVQLALLELLERIFRVTQT